MAHPVVCLRPRADFTRVDAEAPSSLDVSYRAADATDLALLVKSARALVIPAVGGKLSPALFENTALALVQVTGAGLDRLDQATLTGRGIPVANVPGGSNSAVAEYVVTAASVLLRRIGWADAEIRAGRYAAFRARMIADNLAGLEGLLVGIVGFGTIGVAVARAFHRMGCRICFYDPDPRDDGQALGACAVALDELLATSDVVSLHVPLLPATRGLIGSAQLASMKPGAVLINAARGGIVDEAALSECLRAGHLGGVAVDVYSAEPPPDDSPLFSLDGDAARKILFTPHIAGVTRQSAAFLFRSAWENVERVLVHGQAPLHRAY
jgi:phosphoglycerate dehydrogenase-like enzyme